MQERSKRKNFLPTLVVAVFLGIAWSIIFFFVPPEIPFIPLLFLLLTFIATLFLASLLLANTRRGFLVAMGVVTFMLLRHFGIGNYLNLVLIAGVLVAIEYYFMNR